MHILMACDHGAVALKNALRDWLRAEHHLEVRDFGVDAADSVDYPDQAGRLCRALLAGEGQRGILLCGTGLGMSMAANRFAGVRAALCHDEHGARMSRRHNDANVLVLGGRTTGEAVARGIVEVWLNERFEGDRHRRRLEKMDQLGKESES
ncbi:MAG: ribose 5-phosphate isomerase B [Magnetococcales bacterium]|nr:ribose 5-phosphate isomerase B [Magnetococcales bacterium]